MLRIHFLNVGHGDCTLIEHPSGRVTMIDINNCTSLSIDDVLVLAKAHGLSLSDFLTAAVGPGGRSWDDYYESLLVDPLEYFREHISDPSVFRYVQTHPDMDHMSGLHRFFWQEKVPLLNFWDIDHTKTLESSDFDQTRYDELDWLTYRVLRHGGGPDVRHVALKLMADASADFYAQDNIEILSPTQDLLDQCNSAGSWNDASYVLKISHAGRSVILPGDAEAAAWTSILERYPAAALDCDLLKAPHHGRASGYHEDAVAAVDPDVVVCSVGKKPGTDASDRYRRHGATVLSTRARGTMVATIWDDGDLWVTDAAGQRLVTLEARRAAS